MGWSTVACLVTEAPGCETPLTLLSWETSSRSLPLSEPQVSELLNEVPNVLLKGAGEGESLPGGLDSIQHEVHIWSIIAIIISMKTMNKR